MYMKCYRMRDQKKNNPECRYPVFILDFTNFAGFLHRCDEINPRSLQHAEPRREQGLLGSAGFRIGHGV